MATSKKLVAAGYYSMVQLFEIDPEALQEDFGWSEKKIVDIHAQLSEIVAIA